MFLRRYFNYPFTDRASVFHIKQVILRFFRFCCKPLFQLSGVFDTVSGPGLGFETNLRYRLTGSFSNPVSAFLYTLEGAVDFFQQFPLAVHQSEDEFLLVVVGSNISHMNRHT